MSHEVFVILDARFAGDLWRFSRAGHVWLTRSAENEAAARAVWDREPEEYSPLRGVSLFDGSGDACEDFYGMLETIEDHHDEYSAAGPWNTIHVIGLPVRTVRPDRIAEELSVEAVGLDMEGDGFAIRRAAQPGDAPDGASRRR